MSRHETLADKAENLAAARQDGSAYAALAIYYYLRAWGQYVGGAVLGIVLAVVLVVVVWA